MTKAADLAEMAGLILEGDGSLEVDGVSPLGNAGERELSFVQSESYRDAALASPARVLIAPEGMDLPGKTVIRSPHPHLTHAQLTPVLHPVPAPRAGVHPQAAIGQGCTIDESATIHPLAALADGVTVGAHTEIHSGVSLGRDVVVGKDCLIHPNVVVGWGCKIGDRVILHGGTVIGSDGFGFVQHEGRHVKIPHVGIVVVEHDVEMGANCTIDRGTYKQTVIGEGSKLDNMVHIAHNVQVGAYSLMAGQSGIAGTTSVGKYFTVGGQGGVAGHLDLPDHITVGPKSIMTRSGDSGEIYYGFPARPMREWRRAIAQFYGLPKLVSRINRLLKNEEE